MTQPLYGAASRQPLMLGGKKVEYGTTRRLKDGTLVYEFTPPRVPGKPKPSPQVLKGITTATDAKHAIEQRLPLTRSGEIGDRTARLQPLYELALAAMRSGDFTHSTGSYAPRSIELFRQRMEDENHGVLKSLGPGAIVADIRTAHLRAYMTQLKAKGLSGSTVRGYISAASALLRFAVEREIRDFNPANNIGRGERPSSKRRSEPRYLSIAEAERLFAKMTDESRPVAVAMFYGALRVTEALSLKWSDVADKLAAPGTKTAASAASVPMLPALARELRAHRERQAKRGFQFIAPDALVFQTFRGRPVSRRNVLRAIHTAGGKAGLNPEGTEQIGCHDLRHSAAANALNSLSMSEASKLLRHANPQVTATVYAGLTDDGTEKLGDKLVAGGFGA